MEIRKADFEESQLKDLIADHLATVSRISPPCSIHALRVDSLDSPEIDMWTVWDGNFLIGCGALKHIDSESCELKSMKTHPSAIRKGVATALMHHLIGVAKSSGYRRMLLETGSQPEFEPARSLYSRFGFVYCEPFADYRKDPNSVFMTLNL